MGTQRTALTSVTAAAGLTQNAGVVKNLRSQPGAEVSVRNGRPGEPQHRPTDSEGRVGGLAVFFTARPKNYSTLLS